MLTTLTGAYGGILSVRIEDENGAAVPARVYLIDSRGEAVFPANTIRYDNVRPDGISERHFVPPEGTFSLEPAQGVYRITVERGKEYLPRTFEVSAPSNGELKRTIKLRRWTSMAARGWYSADMHVHRRLTELGALMSAEDLTVAIPISKWRTNQKQSQDPDLDRFLALADSEGTFHVSPGRFFPVLNEELEPRASALLASWLGGKPVALEYPLAKFGEAVARAGGVSDSEKATSLEMPALAAVGAFKTLGLVNNHIWRTESYRSAWGAWPDRMLREYSPSCAGFVQSGFDMYSALLNSGFAVRLSAGSASGVHPVPPGWSRVYVKAGRPLSARGWVEGLRAGRSFVTTGPMLMLRVNGKEPGDAIRGARFPLALEASVEMLSPRPVSQMEIVVNGEVHVVNLTAAAGEVYAYRGSIKLTIHESSWIAARWVENRGNTCDAAHSSPVYAWKGEQPVPVLRKDAAALLDRVERLIEDVSGGGDLKGSFMVDPAETRAATLEYLKRAREIYRAKLAE